MHEVSRHVLIPDGATFKTQDEDFLVSDNLDFHPTDVIEDAEGSLLVVDTGGWYKLCCPTSQLHKPDILGAIYRIRKTGASKVDDPRGTKLAWDKLSVKQLAELLNDTRPAVRRRAIESLAGKGEAASKPLTLILCFSASIEQRRAAIWTAARLGNPNGQGIIHWVLRTRDNLDESERLAALHAVALWRDADAAPLVLPWLKEGSPHLRRAAAEALGRIGDKKAVQPLLESLAKPADRALQHSLTYALIEIGDREGTAAGLKSDNPHVRCAALAALDQMEAGKLSAETVAAELASKDAMVKRTASWIIGRHPEWGASLTGYLRDRLVAKGLSSAETDELVQHLARFARADAVQQLLAEQLAAPSADNRRVALRAMAQSGLKQAPAAWVTALISMLSQDKPDLLEEALATTRALKYGKEGPKALVETLRHVGGSSKIATAQRLAALGAIPNGVGPVDPPLFQFLSA